MGATENILAGFSGRQVTLHTNAHAAGMKVTADAMAEVNIISHDALPAWNDAIVPGTPEM